MWPCVLAWAVAAAPIERTWPEVVEAIASPFAAHETLEVLEPRLATLCTEGVDGACLLADGGIPEASLADACTSGDEVACLGAAWLGAGRSLEADFQTYQTQCEAGSASACASEAMARGEGRGTWRSRRARVLQAEAQCAGGKVPGCLLMADLVGMDRPEARTRHLTRAKSLGADLAPGRLAAMQPPSPARTRALVAACDDGDGMSCMVAVREAAEADRGPLVARACALGRAEGCLADVVLQVDDGSVPIPTAIRRLQATCERGVELACYGAEAYRLGGRPLPWPDGVLPEGRVPEILLAHVMEVGECHKELVASGGEIAVDFTMRVDVDPEGVLLAVVPGGDDEGFGRCLAEAFLGYDSLGPRDREPARAVIRGSSALGAITSGRGGSGDLDARDELLEVVTRRLGLSLERCYLDLGGSPFDRLFMKVDSTLAPSGVLTVHDVVESTGDAPTDACVKEVLDGFVTPARRPAFATRFNLKVDFNVVTLVPDRS